MGVYDDNLRPVVNFSDNTELDEFLFYVYAILDGVEMQQGEDYQLGSHTIRHEWFDYSLYRARTIKKEGNHDNES